MAAHETGSDAWSGAADLLQVIGLNFYNNWGVEHGWPLSRLLLEARRQYPEQRITMGETGNCHFADRHSVAGWLRLIDEQARTGIRGSLVAFVHPSSTGGVLTEIVQPAQTL